MSVTRANTADVPGIVNVHREAFPEFFLTTLGERFLRRFYRALVSDEAALCFVGHIQGKVCGFVVGPLEPAGFFRKLLLREGVGFILDAIPALLRRPWFVARRLWRGAGYRGETPPLRARAVLVSSIAVSPAATGSGIAIELLAAFCEAAQQRGASCVYLLTDRDYNVAANRFYTKAGFVVETEIARSDGRAMNRYVRDLNGVDQDESKIKPGD
jgi:ribosomal protein S18 acetylase RimI-like enzyme